MNASRIAAAKEGSGLDDGGGHGLGVGGGVRVSKVQHPELTSESETTDEYKILHVLISADRPQQKGSQETDRTTAVPCKLPAFPDFLLPLSIRTRRPPIFPSGLRDACVV